MIKNNKNFIKNLINFKSFFILLIILLIIVLCFLSFNILNQFIKQKQFEKNIVSFSEKNNDIIFSIDKIIFFTSCDSKTKTSSATNFTLQNLYSYTDIALFINNNSDKNTLKNTLKSLKISNINFTKTPLSGTPKLFYKNINNFATSSYNENNLIQSDLDFNISSDDNADLSTPTLYNNCANPITLTYINENIKTDYTLTDISKPITYDGSLLKRCAVTLSSIACSLSFDIYIENNNNEKFKSSVFIDIPYENNNNSVYDGNLITKNNDKIYFYRYE